jgi:hypothetical protein
MGQESRTTGFYKGTPSGVTSGFSDRDMHHVHHGHHGHHMMEAAKNESYDQVVMSEGLDNSQP